ncbi:MAG: ABC transporter permease [Proteobacteria bacterium]|nr:ABC transporter permease [Pseudomonadota bacterium]
MDPQESFSQDKLGSSAPAQEAEAMKALGESQAALALGRMPLALEKARLARDLAPGNLAVASHCAVIFSATQNQAEAISALQVLDQASLLDAEQHRQLSGFLAAQGALEASVRHAIKASDGAPENWEFARHCGVLLNFFGRTLEAANYLVRAARAHGNDALIFYHLSVAAGALERRTQAAAFATRAWELEPDNPTYIQGHVHNLLVNGRYDEALQCLEAIFDTAQTKTADLWHLMSVSRNAANDPLGSIDAASAGLALDAEHIGLRLHRGIVLCSLGRYEEALEDMRAVLDLDPMHDEALRVSFAANTELGRYSEAVPYGAAVMRHKPDDEPIGRSMLHILTRRFLTEGSTPIDGNSLAALKRQAAQSRPPRRKFTAMDAFRTQLRVLGALILREIQGRFGRAKLGYLWALFEPLAHISLLVAIIQFTAKGDPPIGNSFALFYFTGIIPYHLFTHTGGALMFAVRANRQLLQLPPVTTLDVFMSRAILEIATEFFVALVLLSAFALLGYDAMPKDILNFMLTFILLGGCAFGAGVINAILMAFFHTWEKVWSISIAIMYFTSGIFYVPSMMPVEVRQILEWGPIFQSIELFRTSMFEGHDPPWLRLEYLAAVSIALVSVGVLAERMFRHKLLEIE